MTAASAQNPQEVVQGCRFCWMCRHVCPVGHVTRRETLTPHGWALTITSVQRGLLTWNADTVDALYACADCGMCRTHCVTDQALPDAIVAARTEVVASGRAPQAVYDIKTILEQQGSTYGPVQEGSLQVREPIGLYVNDAVAARGSRSANAARRLLAAAGIETVPVAVGRSNGLVASALGLVDTAARLGRAVLESVEAAGCRDLMVLTPGDRFAFEHVFPRRLGLPWPAGVAVIEATIALAQAVEEGRLRFRPPSGETPWAYHDPCHAPRVERDTARPRRLLSAALGPTSARELFWRAERAHPCGAIGGLELTQPDLAAELACARLADARAAGAASLVSDDPECVAHLQRHAADDMTVLNLYEVLESRGVF